MKIHTENIPGNLHSAAVWINRQGWADYLVAAETSGLYTVVMFRMPAKLVHRVRAAQRSIVENLHFDDVRKDAIL